MPSGDQRAMPRKTINDKSDLVARKNSSEPKKTASSLFVALRWIIVALEGWMTLLGTSFIRLRHHPLWAFTTVYDCC